MPASAPELLASAGLPGGSILAEHVRAHGRLCVAVTDFRRDQTWRLVLPADRAAVLGDLARAVGAIAHGVAELGELPPAEPGEVQPLARRPLGDGRFLAAFLAAPEPGSPGGLVVAEIAPSGALTANFVLVAADYGPALLGAMREAAERLAATGQAAGAQLH